jgi:cytoskeleton protein RodZ
MNANADDIAVSLSVEAEPPPEGSPGGILSVARRAKRLEIPRVAGELRLTPETIEAIERDDYEKLPSPVFVGGYIRSYAKLLDIDPEPVLALFRNLHPGAEAPPPRLRPPAGPTQGSGGGLVLLLSALILIALAGGAYLWWSTPVDDAADRNAALATDADEPAATPGAFRPERPDPAAEAPSATFGGQTGTAPLGADADAPSRSPLPAPEPPPVALQPSDRPAAQDTAIDDLDSPTALLPPTRPGSALSTGELSAEADDPAAPAPGTAQPPAPADTGTGLGSDSVSGTADTLAGDAAADDADAPDATPPEQVTISFGGPCWVDIRDASGDFKLFGEMSDGDRHVLGGTPPYSLILGNAAVVDMRVGGEPFDVAAIARGNVARFELDPAELAAASEADTGAGAGD